MIEIPGFPDYFADAEGAIWSAKRNSFRRLKDFIGSHGYKYVNLVKPNGDIEHIGVHRLVLLAFCGPSPTGMEARHLDGSRTNNRLANLCWGTRLENAHDRYRHGTIKRKQPKFWIGCKGHCNGNSKLTPEDVRSIRRYHESGLLTHAGLAELFAVSSTCIAKIIRRQRWNHI